MMNDWFFVRARRGYTILGSTAMLQAWDQIMREEAKKFKQYDTSTPPFYNSPGLDVPEPPKKGKARKKVTRSKELGDPSRSEIRLLNRQREKKVFYQKYKR